MRQLLTSALVALSSGAVAAGVGDVIGTTIDTAGFSDISVQAHLGAVGAGGTVALKLAQGDLADGSDKADLLSSAVTATDASNKGVGLDIHRPTKRYVTPILSRAVANTAVVAITVILTGGAHAPVTQTYIVNKKALNGPNEGLATA